MKKRIFFPPDSTELGELSQQLEADLDLQKALGMFLSDSWDDST